ncbi:MAG: hypothetical protein HY707_00140 [Ignavibacteriae bacterium]|nr:hypothetical protein [Ignavibacteriota bacterium]
MDTFYQRATLLQRCSIPIALLLIASGLYAQNPLEDAVKQLASDNARGYLQPFVDGFGANMNSGLYQSADIGGLGLHLKLEFVGVGTLIGDNEKTFLGIPPPPFPQTPVRTATVFGEQGTIVDDPSGTVQYQFQNGQIKTSFMPMIFPQVRIGNIIGTEAIIRYAPIPKIDQFPKVTLFGIGARHSISQYLPLSPVDLAAGLFYQSLDIGETFEADAFNIAAQASKSFALLTVYGGLQWETSTMSVNYTYTGYGAPPGGASLSFDLDGENNFRLMLGAGLSLLVFNLNADINIGKVTVVSGGVGLGF